MRGGYRQNAGRKKGFASIEAEKAREYIAGKLKTELGPIIDKAIKQARLGDKSAREWLVERAYGKVVNPINMNMARTASSNLNSNQMRMIAEQVLRKTSK